MSPYSGPKNSIFEPGEDVHPPVSFTASEGRGDTTPMHDFKRDDPWIFRTYSGHSTAKESNKLYRASLAKGQTGLSIAFDLPTQTGYDSDHILARGEVGKVGVAISHIGDMRTLFEQIPIDQMNTSMTINATAPWILALYIAVADEQGAERQKLRGTTQNDIIKEYLARGTYIFPPAGSLKLARDLIVFTAKELPKWNPINICSYHLQEAGATPEQELAFALATAITVLDGVKASGQITSEDFPKLVGQISFFVNAGMRFITEMCKMRAFCELWDEIILERYAIEDEKHRRFRYGVQVNSLGLTEQQPENNIARILIEMLSVVLSKNARARAVQLPAWNEALGLPRSIDQQWSLRLQQIMAYESDLLEFDDIFDQNPIISAKVADLKRAALREIATIMALGGVEKAVESGYLKAKLVESNSLRLEAIERGEQIVVGVNKFLESEDSPLPAHQQSILVVPPEVETEQISKLQHWRQQRDQQGCAHALAELARVARNGENIMHASIAAAKVGVTTGEWAQVLREFFGEYRAPTGVAPQARQQWDDLDELRSKIAALSQKLGRRLTFFMAKPGLDGHSNGAEQIAVRARDVGIAVIFDGIRFTPAEIVDRAIRKRAHCVGLSILSGSHVALAREVRERLDVSGYQHIPLVVGGIIPPNDAHLLQQLGVTAVFTPKDFKLNQIIEEIAAIIESRLDDLADVR